MFELFPTFSSFSAYIVALGILAVLSIIFEPQLIKLEDKVRDAMSEKYAQLKLKFKLWVQS